MYNTYYSVSYALCYSSSRNTWIEVTRGLTPALSYALRHITAVGAATQYQ
jgi:hypothetical protein